MAVSFLVQPDESTFSRPALVALEGGRSVAARRRRNVYLRRRLAVAVVALVLLGATVSVMSSFFGGSTVAPTAAASTYEVGAGDTLWSIAGSLHADADRREVVDLLADANGGTIVRPGQHLVIPAEVMALVS